METVRESLPMLQAIAALFQRLDDEGIRYCHWKSTHRLPQALAGATDLDLLIDRGQSQQFKQLLYQCDFKAFISHPQRQYPAIEDYLGFDQATGRLIHLHIHYRLVLGEEYVKNYYLPLEQVFLENTRLQFGIKVPAPELEIIVLVLRALLKYRDRDVLRDVVRPGQKPRLPAGMLAELEHLLAQTDHARIAAALEQHVGFVPPELVFTVLSMIHQTPKAGWMLYRLRRQARAVLAPYQRYSRLRARSTYYRAMLTRERPFARIFRRLLPLRDKHKIPASGGLTIAFIGADGAGKSTIIQHIAKWLSWRLVVSTYYMGNSRPSLVTQAIKRASKIAQICYAGCRRLFGERSGATRLAARPWRLLVYLRHLADSWDRYSRYLAGRRKAAQGAIVIYDRYPLQNIRIFDRALDGPRIASLRNGHMEPLAAKLAQIEERIYHRILPAEHLFVLHVRPDVSQARKPDHSWESIEEKSRAIEQFLPEDFTLTHIDANQPVDHVLLQIKSALWRLL